MIKAKNRKSHVDGFQALWFVCWIGEVFSTRALQGFAHMQTNLTCIIEHSVNKNTTLWIQMHKCNIDVYMNSH